jgi:uncharacterized protein (TIGR04255 family)
MKQKLTFAPLVEAIIEIRWKLEEPQPGLFVDPKYKILVGRLYDRLVRDYPFHEPLPTASMPDEMLAYAVQHRFRVEAGKWPLVQVGPGIVTFNDTEGYSWDDNFERQAAQLMSTLYEIYPDAENILKISGVQLRYIDAINFSFSNENILSFITEKLKIKLSFPDELFNNSPIKSLPSGINTLFSFPITKPMGTLLLRFANGLHNQKEALIWETVVQSKEAELLEMPAKFSEWLNSAHDLTHDMFFKLIEGPLEETFK